MSREDVPRSPDLDGPVRSPDPDWPVDQRPGGALGHRNLLASHGDGAARLRSRPERRLSVAAVLAVVLAATLVLGPPPRPALAGTTIGANLGDGAVGVFVHTTSTRRRTGTSPPPPPRFQYVVVPDCADNRDGPASGGCTPPPADCPGSSPVRVFEAPLGTAMNGPGWTLLATRCAQPGDRLGVVVVPVLTLTELRRMKLPEGSSTVQPPGGRVLVGMPTNVYATSTEPFSIATTVLGLPVDLRITPTRFAWDFGDGTTIGPTTDPGAAYPTLTNAHVYAQRGTYQISMTTWYRAEFSVNSGPYQPVSGETTVTGAVVQVQAVAGRPQLVADTSG